MPHERLRYLDRLIRKALKHSPIVGILGQRQTGKTTLALSIAQEAYVTLDDLEQLSAARERPKAFLDGRAIPFAIDECQLAPELFPALKLHVQKIKKKGQFLLTGSVRFSGREAIRESLTGRIQLLELHPMTLSESKGEALPDLMAVIQGGIEFFRKYAAERSSLFAGAGTTGVQRYLEVGGLPGICFLRDPSARRPRWNSHLDTLLGRDLRLVSETNHPLLKLRELLTVLAQTQGSPVSLTELSRLARISTASLSKLLAAFESLFLIRRILPLGDSAKEAYFLEDQGVASHLALSSAPDTELVRLCFSQIFPHLDYSDPGSVTIYHYETRNGARVPLVFKTGTALLGIIPVGSETPDKKAIGSAQSFLRRYPKAHVLILTQGTETFEFGDRLWSTPMSGCF